jgi:hypothetical protein
MCSMCEQESKADGGDGESECVVGAAQEPTRC